MRRRNIPTALLLARLCSPNDRVVMLEEQDTSDKRRRGWDEIGWDGVEGVGWSGVGWGRRRVGKSRNVSGDLSASESGD